MTPTFTPWPPPSSPRVAPPTGPRPDQAGDERRVPAAAWVAAVGASLVLAAAAVLVVGSWNDIRPEIKLAGLVAVNAVAAAAAIALRPFLPVVSRTLAHLAAAMAVPSGVAVLAAAGRPWPEAVLAGGAAGVTACLFQSRRWAAPLLVPAAEAAGVFGLAGVATLTHAPLGLLVAGVALALLAVRHEAGAVRLVALAPAVPLLAVLGAFGVGSGTAVRLGARGGVLGWAAPVAGLVAAATLALVARRRHVTSLTVASLLAAVAGVATGLVELRPRGVVLFGLAGAALVVVAALDERAEGEWAPLLRVLGVAGRWVVLSAAAVGMVVAVDARSSGTRDGALGLALAAWAAAAAAFVFAPSRPGRDATVPPAPVLRVVTALALAGSASAFAGGSLAGLAAVAVAAVAIGLLARPADLERVAVAACFVPLAWAASPDSAGAWAALAVVAVGAAGLVATVRGPATSSVASLTVASVAVWAGLSVAPVWPSSAWAPVVGMALGTGVLAVGRRWLLAAAAVPWVALAVMGALDVTPAAMAVGALVMAVALTGAALVSERPGPVDVAAVSTAVVALAASAGYPGGALTSAAGVVIGAQGWLYGALRRQRNLSVAGRIVLAVSLLTVPSTTGLAQDVVDALRPLGIDRLDVAVGVVSLALLSGGWWLRRSGRAGPLGSWPAYGPGLLLAGLHLLSSQSATGQVGRAAVAIAIGVVAVAVGGLRRLGAPLVLGTLLIAASSVLAGGAQLAELPVWIWLAVGGVGLLLVAVLIERGGPKAGPAGPGERLRTVWHRFD